ncbi:MAG: TonB-dependent receptor [Acidobacteriota bacterium]|jgi:hypothetical protein|nr:TonB-dependent receptor [Acidobacteriota bacterium]
MPLVAQTGALHLEGVVWDPSGNPLPGVAIAAIEDSTGRRAETVSDSDGYYRLMVLQPGIYSVTAKAEGFKDVAQRDIHLSVPGGVALNISFEVSAIDNEVGPMNRPRTLDSDLADAFTQRDLEDYPLFDRNPLTLTTIQPGVQINGGSESISPVNGTRPTANVLLRDGLTLTDPLAPGIGRSLLPINSDSISDVQIITSNAGAEYGSAGAQVVLTSRQGTTKWTGNLYDYFNTHRLNASDYFKNAGNIGQPKSMRNLFGGVISGHLTPKTAVFGSYEGNRTEQQIYHNRRVLTDEARTGLFRWYTPDDTTRNDTTVKSFDIATHDPRNLGIDPTVASILNLTPRANNFFIGSDGFSKDLNIGGYEFMGDTHYHQDSLDARVDYDLDARHHLFFRGSWDRTDATDTQNGADAAYPGLNSGYYKTNDFSATFGSDYTFSPTMINELRVGYVRATVDYERPDRTTGTMIYSTLWADPLSTSYPKSYRLPSFEVSDTFSHSKNVHAFKYGFSLHRSATGSTDYNGAYPTVTFGNSGGAAPTGIGPSLQADDGLGGISAVDRDAFERLYNSLLGRLESVNQTFHSNLSGLLPAGSARERNFVSWSFSGFAQDNWKIKPNVTLNLGLRYEFFKAPSESNGYQGVLEQASDISPTANIADFRVRQGSWYNNDKLNFAPRVGMAWDAFGTGSTVVRAAYGIYYDQLGAGVADFIDRYSYGFEQNVPAWPNESGASDIRLSDGYTVTAPALLAQQPAADRARSIAVLDSNLKTPRIHQMHATLERQWAGLLWEIGYSRTRGTKLFQYLNLNQTKVTDDFLASFRELKAYRTNGTPVSAGNTLVNIFGTPLDALEALRGYNFDSNQVGAVANALDRENYSRYAAAGISDFYLRNFPQFDQFIYGTNAADSWYDAVRAGVRKSGANYGIKAFYTWSRSKDTSSATGSSYVAPWDSFNPGAAKDYSDYHRNHVFTFALRYALPFGRDLDEETDQPGWVNALLANWSIGTLVTYESGARFSVNSGMENQFGGTTGLADLNRTSQVTIGELYRDSQGTIYWIDPTTAGQFDFPEAGRPGTSGRNAFTGPKYFNLDIAMHKSFRIRESQAFQLRLEAYNVFNNAHLGLPDTNLTSSGFGTITSTAGSPRKLQFALRYQF